MININKLNFSYTGMTPYQLNDINIKIPKGSFTSIVGENGSCKTTLLKLILGQLKPINGDISLDTKNIGYVPQKIEGFNSQFTITVNEILKCHGKAIKIKYKDEIDKVLSYVKMEDFKHSLIGSLSGGQQQRIFIARALMGKPEILLLDELATGIDESTQNEIYNLLYNLNKNENITIVSVEHNRSKAIKYSSNILEIADSLGTIYTTNEYINKINGLVR
ncbi:zinc transport system ATP-binding protein [Clostridium cavendishii DSM 21758]|uniref:Zinc transport system ATP-binding protein n=1 Tax=Clostridium cavendishii DSM 21758 TaxID=1121302 RepID=A0A1M6CNP8_9CLOT|nr:metal ABC transporter ATP-binding protein [Clostridium cavendishii]SHI62662.1 zinc transport system ATP-binding protein [Clostridium cavendishii DSM 21758]